VHSVALPLLVLQFCAMKAAAASLLLGILAAFSPESAGGVATVATPVSKVMQLLGDLQKKVLGEGEAAQKVYAEASEWCEERSKDISFEIKTGKAEVANLKATIESESARIASLGTKVEELSASIASDEADLKAATELRTKEAADYTVEEKELVEVIDMLERVSGILERDLTKSGASELQLRGAGSLAQAFGAMVQASALTSADVGRLAALVQSSQDAAEGDASLGAPTAAAYQGQSGGIVDTLEELQEKAQGQLSEAQKKEITALHNFALLKQSLEDAIKFATKDLGQAKQDIAASGEKKSAAEGDLAVTSKDLAGDVTALRQLHHDCMSKAQDFEVGVKSRDEELNALAGAKKAISEATGGAAELTYGLNQVSLLQVAARSKISYGASLEQRFQVVRLVRELSRQQHSPALAQLASRIASTVQASSEAGEDPFTKIKGLIAAMIERLQDEAGADASHKAYCDKELSETNAKQDDKTAQVGKLSAQIDQMSARSVQLKEEVAGLQKALAGLAKSQAESSKLRQEEQAVYTKSKADMEQGLEGVKLALKLLNEYYTKDAAQDSSAGASTGIIGLLEVVESDFSKGLAELNAAEEGSRAAYEQEMKENEIEKASKDQDVKYKAKEAADLDKAVGGAQADSSGFQAELDALVEYLGKIKEQCIAKAEPYEERVRRREAEISGLKEALKTLEGEAVLFQVATRRTLRGVRPHVVA